MAEWTYVLDVADQILEVGEGWDEFALENDAPEVVRAQVIGTRLWDHVSDRATEQLLRHLITLVRERGREVRIPFRCDGPQVRRSMSFRATPLPEGGVRIRTHLLREEAYVPPLRLFDRRIARSGGMIRMCSWCNRIAVGPNWVEVETAVRDQGFFEGAELPAITHGMCPTCGDAFHAEIDRVFGSSAPRT